MMVKTCDLDLRKLNSITKYPAIPTYHAIDPKNGLLLEHTLVTLQGDLVATEKIDGTNVRIILLPDHMFVLASREELLYARGDLIGNDSMGIVSATKNLAEDMLLRYEYWLLKAVTVVYAELYGGNIGGSGKSFQQYTTKKKHGLRIFDIAIFFDKQFLELFEWPLEKFSTWRENGGQPYFEEEELLLFTTKLGFEVTPRISIGPIPITIKDTLTFLKESIPQSFCALDDSAPANSEGLVIRSKNRKTIAKLRFEDYERTLKRRRK